MSETPIPVPPLTNPESDDDSIPEPFRLRLRQLLADPTLSHAQIARKMSQFLEEQTPPTTTTTPANPCQSLPTPANSPHPRAPQIWQNKPNFPLPNTANHCQPPPTRPKTNPISNPPFVAPSLRGFVAHSPRQRPLTPNQLRAIHLLRAGHPAAVIAHTLQINRHTISTWKRLPHFQQELKHQISQEQETTGN